jgi:hypothetical protein
MNKQTTIKEITALFIQNLKNEVLHWQSKALDASLANDAEACRQALRQQELAIQNLIKLAETAARTGL